MTTYRADLHIHSCLSPCAELSASPRAIAAAARKAGLHMAAITDHNTALNAPAFESACRDEGIVPVFGMEVTTREEIHALVLFPDAQTAVEMGKETYESLKSESFDPESFGDQIWVNEQEEIEGALEKLLILGATNFSLDDLGPWCREQGGILIPAHIDRPLYGILDQLGFLPGGPFEAVETTQQISSSLTGEWTVTASSDAHVPSHVGRRHFEFTAESCDFFSLADALKDGRCRAVYQSPVPV